MGTELLKKYLKRFDDGFDVTQIVGAKNIMFDGTDIAYVFDDEPMNFIINAAINRLPFDESVIYDIAKQIFIYAALKNEYRGEV
ncbi:hypothetical protein OXT66_05760 [Lentilactobacillus senioris]|uniref:hypothetical protein n=1 Tax=Lentilactobacillus senioris TaxID=931534 RepID=UPI0022804AC1|nr:hypothetical protein [Lentilactobacillus senioris]MCY9807055.1 hypothetical protein [Lentilactobacillus senioris]